MVQLLYFYITHNTKLHYLYIRLIQCLTGYKSVVNLIYDENYLDRSQMKTKRRLTIGLLTADLTDTYETEIIKGVIKKAEEEDINIICFSGGTIKNSDNKVYPSFLQTWKNSIYELIDKNNIDGLLTISDAICPNIDMDKKISFHNKISVVPLVTIGEKIPGFPGIVVDELKGTNELIDHLVCEHKCKDIAFIGYMEEISFYKNRFYNFENSLNRYNIKIDSKKVVRGGFSIGEIHQSLDVLLESGNNIDVIICVDDYMASHTMNYLSDQGVLIPSDMIITGFDDISESKYLAPTLTTVKQPLYDLGYKSAEKIVKVLSNIEVEACTLLESELIVRRSCGCFYVKEENISYKAFKDTQTIIKCQFKTLSNIKIINKWAKDLENPFLNGIKNNSENQFYKGVSNIAREIVELDISIHPLKGVVSIFISLLMTNNSSDHSLFYFDRLRGNSMQIIEDFIYKKSMHNRLKNEREALLLYNISQQLVLAWDNTKKLKEVILKEFPPLGIRSFYVSTYLDKNDRKQSKIKIAFNNIIKEKVHTGTIYNSNQLLPHGVKNIPVRSNFVVIPLFYKNETLGTVLFEMNTVNGLLYESLTTLLSGILKESELINKVQSYATGLEQIVSERTSDIRETNKKLLEEIDEKEKIENALQKEKELAQLTLESIGDGVIITDTKGYINYLNPVAELLTGFDNNSANGLQLKKVINTNNELNKDIFCEPLETVLKSKSGKLKPISLFAAYIPDNNGRNRGIIYISRDISKRKKAEKEAKKQLTQLIHAGKMASIGRLVSGVAHEINNPNNFIMMNAPVLKDIFESIMPVLNSKSVFDENEIFGGLEYNQLKEHIPTLLEGIIDGSERINNIIKELKNYAQPNLILKEKGVNINSIVKSSINLLSAQIKKSTNNFIIYLDDNIPAITCNQQNIEQVIINLLSNACQAINDKDKSISVKTGYNKLTEKIEVSITDEGIGIPEKNLNLIMDPFFTTKREHGGLGLGLSISSKIIQDHNGHLTVSSIEGVSTTFVLSLEKEGVDETISIS